MSATFSVKEEAPDTPLPPPPQGQEGSQADNEKRRIAAQAIDGLWEAGDTVQLEMLQLQIASSLEEIHLREKEDAGQ